jgi:hypoxanthine phosphoribosyltransferase
MAHPRKRSPGSAEAAQSELPRGLLGRDRSGRLNEVRELSWAQFDGVVQALALEISATYDPDLVVGIAHGGLFVGGALASALGAPFHPVRISRRSRDATASRRPRMTGTMPREVKGARILLVDDVAASGDTLLLARALARKAGARQVRTATLLCRDQGFAPDWTVLMMETPLLFPWDYGPVSEDVRFDLVPAPATGSGLRRTRA